MSVLCTLFIFYSFLFLGGPCQLTRGGFQIYLCFYSALKHRYRIPLTLPHQQIPLKPAGVPMFDPTTDSATYPSATPIARSKSPASLVDRPGVAGSSSVQTSSSSSSPPPRSMGQGTGMHFDPLMIARRDDGWEMALQNTLETWLGAVCKELGSGDTTR